MAGIPDVVPIAAKPSANPGLIVAINVYISSIKSPQITNFVEYEDT
jgi:hypothetical protein